MPTPRNCPGLTISRKGAIWTNSVGRQFDLLTEKRLSLAAVAQQMKRSMTWVYFHVKHGSIYPVIHYNAQQIEVFQCSVDDYILRSITRSGTATKH